MRINELKPTQPRKKKKRIGRGGKRGAYSGRGLKGQRARAGHRIRPAERDILLKFPKLRGIKNKPIKPKPVVLKINNLIKLFPTGIINKEGLLAKGLIKNRRRPVKIIGGGKIEKIIQIKGIVVSKNTKTQIEKAGGQVI